MLRGEVRYIFHPLVKRRVRHCELNAFGGVVRNSAALVDKVEVEVEVAY
jgi:hypothetical protein